MMNSTKQIAKLLAATMLALATTVVWAQSSVTIYGIVDAAVERADSGSGSSVTRLVSGQGSASRLGFRGTEDLGGGLRAIFSLEAALNADNGTGGATGGGLAFDRQSWVGLAGVKEAN